MFVVALFTIAKTWNQLDCPSIINWTKKIWHIYTMEYYAAIKNDEFMSFVEMWMNLETIILSKLRQEQQTKHCIFSLIGRCWTMRTHGHMEGSITHWGWLQGLGKRQWGVGRLERDNMGRNARYRWQGDGGSKPHCHVCTYATILHDLHMYPRIWSTIKIYIHI